MVWSYDQRRCGNANSETGEFISDVQAMDQQRALQQQQAQMAQMANYAGLGQGISGVLTGGIGISNLTSSNSNYTIGGYITQRYTTPVAAAPVKDDEFSWLRKRVDDVCWKQAA